MINWSAIGLLLSGVAIGWCARSLYGLWRQQRRSRPISREEQECVHDRINRQIAEEFEEFEEDDKNRP